ncbi:MAG: LamG domain-containing protein, partial [Sedimentisphaerales bacterium]|nr:LamG domain-containing protein [Sedimentisphaerales bacterium]
MCRRFVCFISLVLVLSVVTNSSADLVAHFGFDEGSGNVAYDTSGNGNDGALNGGPKWAAGYAGGALDFDGVDDYVELTRVVQDDFTLMAWIKTDTPGINLGSQGYQGSGLIWSDVAGVANDFILAVLGTKLSFFCGNPDTSVNSDKDVTTGEWVHVAATRSAQEQEIGIYIDGEHENTIAHGNGSPLNALDTMAIGGNVLDSRYFAGLVDDVQLYDNVLGQAEILSAMQNEPWPYAFAPDPADGAIHAATWVTLSWKPGQLAVSHDVYLGDHFDDVDNGTGDTYRGNQGSTFLVAGFPGFPYPEGLVPGTTYYWRIDEVNEVNPDSPWKGDVWSFSVPPKSAYGPNPADGAGAADTAMTLKWTAGFGAKLHTVFFGDSYDEVDNATVGMPSGSTSYSPGPLEREKVYYWRVDEFDGVGTYKGDVWTFTTPGAVGEPQPAIGADDIEMNAVLSWTPADSAASHQLYIGKDKAAVRNAITGEPGYKGSVALGTESFDPGLLDAKTTYYWRVDEMDAQGNTVKGPVWVFTTGTFLLVDDFEGYTDDDAAGEAIWLHWIDGYGVADNGAQV